MLLVVHLVLHPAQVTGVGVLLVVNLVLYTLDEDCSLYKPVGVAGDPCVHCLAWGCTDDNCGQLKDTHMCVFPYGAPVMTLQGLCPTTAIGRRNITITVLWNRNDLCRIRIHLRNCTVSDSDPNPDFGFDYVIEFRIRIRIQL